MRLKKYLTERDQKAHEAALYKFVVVCLSLATVVLSYSLYSIRTYHRTILVPPQIRSQIEITDFNVSNEYIRDWVFYISSLAFSYTPATVHGQFTDLLRFYHPSSYPSAQAAWKDLADLVYKTRVTQVFTINPSMLVFNPGAKEVVVGGIRTQYKDNVAFKSQQIKYHIQYTIEGGKFSILNITEEEVPE